MTADPIPALAILTAAYLFRLVREFLLVSRSPVAGEGRISLAFFGISWALAAMGSWGGVVRHGPQAAFFWIGILGMLACHHLRLRIARSDLQGSYGTGMAPHGTLVESGAYRRVRHPVYLCYASEILFVALICPGLLGLAAFLLNLGATLWRIPREEDLLHGVFQADWDKYCQKVRWRLIPRIW
jgi:protein-S-isoprenylcysteine O-methyltransferase Ste14